MKKLIGGLFLLGMAGFVSAQTITFEKNTIDYRTISAGADEHRTFTFKNTGNKPLVLSNVKPSCGCTTPEWTKTAIQPGKTGTIKVKYDTKIKGEFRRSIEVYSNDPKSSRSVLSIKGNVK